MEWFRKPKWADWEAWRDAANEVAALGGEVLPWPYNPEPRSAYFAMMERLHELLEPNVPNPISE